MSGLIQAAKSLLLLEFVSAFSWQCVNFFTKTYD